MKRVHDSLERVLLRHRLVFWYDGTGEWRETFDSFAAAGVEKLAVANDEFATKVRIVREKSAEARFLVYLPTTRPADPDNWLLDLLLQGHEYRADRASLGIEEAGLGTEMLHLAEEHAAFFNAGKRVQALRDLVHRDDDARTVRLKMMAVLTGAQADVDALLLHFLGKALADELVDPVSEALGGARLADPFWREVGQAFGYPAAEPSVRDFAVALFRAANPLDAQARLHPHARVFLQRWKDSQALRATFEAWSARLAGELQVASALNAAGDRASVGDADTFELFERYALHRLSAAFQRGAPGAEVRAGIQERRTSIWFYRHQAGYEALEQAVELRELLAGADLLVESVDAGLRRYVASWWRIDAAYRRCVRALRSYGQNQVMAPVAEWAEKSYLNNFLLLLADRWSDRVCPLSAWESSELVPQRRFFDTYVAPFLSRGQKVFVIVSDALRYEAAQEMAERLRGANRWTAEVEAVLGSLPSYTQLGMASLLPGQTWAVDPGTGNVTVDGRSATGTEARDAILKLACGGRAAAVKATEFLEMNAKVEGRALMRDHDVIYIFHNHIDKVGDERETESKAFDAVAQAFEELDQVFRKVANINGSNMLLTADHGFLFQQEPVDEGDMVPLPQANELQCQGRRYLFGRGIRETPKVKVFDSPALKLGGDWSVAIPLSLGRFPQRGSGKRYVHGGASLQEVVVPVVRIHKARTDDTGVVEVEPLRLPAKITTGQLSVALFQDRPAGDKIRGRALRVGVYAKDGALLSELKPVTFDSREEEARMRETNVVLVLSRAADAYNDQDVELRLEETVPGTSQTVVYRRFDVRLQKPFTSDFDEF